MSADKPKNCWEYFRCGRIPSATRTIDGPVCKVYLLKEYDGKNRGVNAGRYCWRVVGTLCGGQVQGSHAVKIETCTACEFFKQVQIEEGKDFIP